MVNKELFPLNSEKDKTTSIKDIFLKYLRYWYLFLIGALLGVIAAYLHIRFNTVPLYSISSKILIRDDKAGVDLSSIEGVIPNGSGTASKDINNEIEAFHSKSLMQRVVQELSLNVSYFLNGRLKDSEIYGSAVPIRLIVNNVNEKGYGKEILIRFNSNNTFKVIENNGKETSHKLGQQIRKPYGVFTVVAAQGISSSSVLAETKILVQFQDLQQVAKHYSQAIQVAPIDKNSSVIVISLTDPIPEKGKDIINKLVEVYNKEAVEDKNLKAESTLNFLDERLRYITSDLSEVEKDVETLKKQNDITDVSTQASNYVEQASNYNRQLSEWAIQIDVLESIERYISVERNRYRMVPSTLTIQDPTLASLISKFNELQLERERLLRTALPSNPLVLNINGQIEDLRLNIRENLRNIKNGLLITSNNLRASSGQYQAKINRVPSIERELQEINRQQTIKQNLYLYLLQKREETALSLAANISNSRVIDPAISSDFPIAPNKKTIYLMSLLLGLSIPFAGIFIKDSLNNMVQTQTDVTKATITPILGEICHNKSNNTMVVTKGNHASIVEMFRLIRAKLRLGVKDEQNTTILVTSSMKGEGKTFISINIGASIALAGKSVVLIDLDLRNSELSNYLGMAEREGISDFLEPQEKISIEEIINPYEQIPGLFVIGAGPTTSYPAELILSPKLVYLINDLKEKFDCIIIDSPPVGQVADAFGISHLINFTLYIVRYNYTLKNQISTIEHIYKNKELPNSMIVLNDGKNEYNYGYSKLNRKLKKSLRKERYS